MGRMDLRKRSLWLVSFSGGKCRQGVGVSGRFVRGVGDYEQGVLWWGSVVGCEDVAPVTVAILPQPIGHQSESWRHDRRPAHVSLPHPLAMSGTYTTRHISSTDYTQRPCIQEDTHSHLDITRAVHEGSSPLQDPGRDSLTIRFSP